MTLKEAYDSLVKDIDLGNVEQLPTKTGKTSPLTISQKGNIKWQMPTKSDKRISPNCISYDTICKVYKFCSSVNGLQSINDINSYFRTTVGVKRDSTYLYAVLLEVLKRMEAMPKCKEFKEGSDMMLINLTHNLSYRPSISALNMFWETLTAGQLGLFHPHSIILWEEWLFSRYKNTNPIWDLEQSVALNIPIFLVDGNLSGKSIYVPVLGRHIPVPKDIWPNIPVVEETNMKDPQCENIPIICQEAEHCQRCVDDCPLRKQVICPREGMIDVWGCFTVIPDISVKGYEPYKFNGMPAIFLWMDKIMEATTNESELEMLFVKVLLHELAHALMYTGELGSGEFYKWNEECLANAYALSKIKQTRNISFYNFAKAVVLKQPDNYALGAKYVDICNDYDICKIMEEWVHIKELKSIPQIVKDRWLSYVKDGVINSRELSHYYRLMRDDVYLYDDKLYLDEEVVWQVIHDYAHNNPRKTLNDIKNVFPDNINKHFAMYDIWPNEPVYEKAKVEFENRNTNHLRNNIQRTLQKYDERRFFYNQEQILHAADCDFVISNYWHPDSMPEFINAASKEGITITKEK